MSESSVITMTSSARNSLTRRLLNSSPEDSSLSSLAWDNVEMLTQLSNLDQATLFEETFSLTSSTSEDVFFLDTRTSTPKTRRITRSMSANGDISPNYSPVKHRFSRGHRFRQGLRLRRRPRVQFSEGVEQIQEKIEASTENVATRERVNTNHL